MSSLQAFEKAGSDALENRDAGVSGTNINSFLMKQARNAANLERANARFSKRKTEGFSYRFTSAVKGFIQVFKGEGFVIPVHVVSDAKEGTEQYRAAVLGYVAKYVLKRGA